MLQELLELIFPAQCGGCGKIGMGACVRCLPRSGGARFRLETLEVDALGAYEGGLRRAVLALKSGRRDVAYTFAQVLSERVNANDVIVPVPTTAARRRERGFDGCELMARHINELTGVLVLRGLVQVAGDRQRGRDRTARLAARERFEWCGESLYQSRVSLLDDVVTTGATLEDCAATLRVHGAVVENAIVVARA